MEYKHKTVGHTIATFSDFDAWYIKEKSVASATIYWFITGKKPPLSLSLARSFYRTKRVIEENIYNRAPINILALEE